MPGGQATEVGSVLDLVGASLNVLFQSFKSFQPFQTFNRFPSTSLRGAQGRRSVPVVPGDRDCFVVTHESCVIRQSFQDSHPSQ
jgi:hypothetical protein